MHARSKLLSLLALSFATLACVYLFNYYTRILPDVGLPYIDHLGYRLQVRQLVAGHLTLADSPWGAFYDATWGLGLNQPWGLGVPLLMVPFELLARACGMTAGFPDRIFLLLLVAATAALCLAAFRRTQSLAAPEAGTFAAILFLSVMLAAALFVRPLALMINNSLGVYEESTLVSCLWANCGLALLALCATGASRRRFLFSAFWFGTGAVFRPTMFLYGAAYLVILYVLTIKDRPWVSKTRVGGLALFSVSTAFVLITNTFRFGYPFEWGYSTNFTGAPLNDIALRFGYPFQHEPALSAARELFGSLFFVTTNQRGIEFDSALSFQSETWRNRELIFSTFTPFFLWLLVPAIALAVFALWRLRHRGDGLAFRVIASLFAAGLGCCFILSVFYMWAPSISSRYMVDFIPAFTALIVAMGLGGLTALPKFWRPLPLVAALGFLAWLRLFESTGTHAAYYPIDAKNRLGYSGAEVEEKVNLIRSYEAQGFIPSKYRCQSQLTWKDLFPDGWKNQDCLVDVVTSAFLPYSRCIDLAMDALGSQAHYDSLLPRAVKSGRADMVLTDGSVRGTTMTLTYCVKPYPFPRRLLGNPKFELITVDWADPYNTAMHNTKLRLLSLSVAEQDHP